MKNQIGMIIYVHFRLRHTQQKPRKNQRNWLLKIFFEIRTSPRTNLKKDRFTTNDPLNFHLKLAKSTPGVLVEEVKVR